jgi:hypothetical protein
MAVKNEKRRRTSRKGRVWEVTYTLVKDIPEKKKAGKGKAKPAKGKAKTTASKSRAKSSKGKAKSGRRKS